MRYVLYIRRMTETVAYHGTKFRRYEGRKYFTPGHADRLAGVEDLHREVWKREVGPIPDGWHVHHVDFDPSNNDVSNLQCLAPPEHEAIHAATRSELGRSPEFLAHLALIRHLAAEWHGTPAGIAWHREHGAESWKNRKAVSYVCDHCGTTYETRSKKGTERFCSDACKAAARRTSGADDVSRTCAHCGAAFTVNRYSKTATCSKSCSAKRRWAARRATA